MLSQSKGGYRLRAGTRPRIGGSWQCRAHAQHRTGCPQDATGTVVRVQGGAERNAPPTCMGRGAANSQAYVQLASMRNKGSEVIEALGTKIICQADMYMEHTMGHNQASKENAKKRAVKHTAGALCGAPARRIARHNTRI